MDKSRPHVPRVVTAYRNVDDLPPSASHAFSANAETSVELSAYWFANLQRGRFSDDAGVRYYSLDDCDGAPAILPLRLARSGVVRQILSLSNYYTSLYAPITVPSGTSADLADILNAASRDCGTAHVMRFAPMDPCASSFEKLVQALRDSNWIPFRFFCFGNWYLKVEDSWSDYLRKREGKVRSTIKRMGKKFATEGGKLEMVTDPSLADHAIKAFNDVYATSWKQPEPYPEFIPGLIRTLAQHGELRLGIATIGDRPVASQLWSVSHGKASIFKLAYDEAFAALSPGTLLTAHLMEHVIDRDHVQEVDYLIGDDPYKQSWMSHRRERWGIIAYNARSAVGLTLAARETIGRLLRRLLPA